MVMVVYKKQKNNTQTLMVEAEAAPCPLLLMHTVYLPSSGGEGATKAASVHDGTSRN